MPDFLFFLKKNADNVASKNNSSWPASIASLLFAFLTWQIFHIYGIVHWQIFSRLDSEDIDRPCNELGKYVSEVLRKLEIYHLIGVLSFIFAIWAFRGKPRWLAWLCLPFSLFALIISLSIM